jgi:hypothetical protein
MFTRVTIVLTALAATTAHAQTITNGDFSSGVTGWTVVNLPNVEPAISPTTAAGPFATGNAFRVNPGGSSSGIESGARLRQILNLSAGVPYVLSGDLAIQALSANADGGTITVRMGGQTLHTFDVVAIQAGTLFSSFNAPFATLVAGPTTLEIEFTRSFPNFASNVLHWADNITLVPAPGTGLIVGAIALGAIRRRR